MIFTDFADIPSGYEIIYADPPWPYRDTTRKNHYDRMTMEQLKALPVADIAADNCALFLWCTWPTIFDGVKDVIEAWGFKYKTVGFDWIKRCKNGSFHIGMGSYTRANPEPCLLAVRGKVKRVNAGVRSLLVSEVGRHSVKPPEVRERIITLLGDRPRIELFARQTAEGWDSYGNEL